MRALIVVLALVGTPFLAGVSQSPQGSNCDNGLGDEHRSDSGQLHAHRGLCVTQPPLLDADHDGVPDDLDQCPDTPLGTTVDATGCPTLSSGDCPGSQVSGGTATIRGRVELGQSPFTLLKGWCVELRDAASDAVLATTVSTDVAPDGMNNFLFMNVPPGAYIICEQLLDATWHQTEPLSGPSCGVNPDLTPRYGYAVTVMETGGDYSFFWLGNLH